MSCFTQDAVHYFPPGLPDIPWRGAEVIARKWIWCIENLGSQWSIEKVLVSHDSDHSIVAEALVQGGSKLVGLREDELGLEEVFLRVTRGETQ